MIFRRARAIVAILAALTGSGCGIGSGFNPDLVQINGATRTEVGMGQIFLRWRVPLISEFAGAYAPIETSVPALDPMHDRVYVGSSAGSLWALTSEGRKVWRYEANASIDSEAAVDPRTSELFFGTGEGVVVSLAAEMGNLRWQKSVGAPVRNQPVLTADAVYVVTANDVVLALSRATGEVLWRYHRDLPEGFSLAGHAGLTLSDGKLFTGFTDGVAVALDPADGSVIWERDTTADLSPENDSPASFKDIDTTPVVVGNSVFVASFTAGLYELAASSGGVRVRDSERTGIVSIAYSDTAATTSNSTDSMAGPHRFLVLSSSDDGVVNMDFDTRRVLWKKPIARGAATAVDVVGDEILVGENLGGFLTLKLISGAETARYEFGHGFAARAAVSGRLAFVLGNGGSLFSFGLR